MKKIVFVVILLLVGFLSFGQDYVEDMDGFDWIQMDWGERVAYVQGFYAAYSSIAERFAIERGGANSMTEEDMAFIEEYFYISVSTGDMVERITEFFSPYENRKYQLYAVLMAYAGKDYWSTGETTQSGSTSSL